MNYIRYGKREISFEIKRGSRKRTVAICVNPMATVTVFSPPHLDDEEIRMIVRKKARWILGKQELMGKEAYSNPVKEFVSGESFSYLGRYYRLKVIKSSADTERKCRLVNGRFFVEVDGNRDRERDKTAIKTSLINWYLEHAEEKIRERVSRFGQQIGKLPVSVKVRNQKKRWGSCSREGIIHFNWKIIMAPISVMDYLVVHELCHLIYPQHSSEFWQKVRSIIPDYEKKGNWLRKLSFQTDVWDK